ncbi:hypothetical protein [Trichococcus palustris]|nr:hypothetical protein [Trichococcus palustris]
MTCQAIYLPRKILEEPAKLPSKEDYYGLLATMEAYEGVEEIIAVDK